MQLQKIQHLRRLEEGSETGLTEELLITNYELLIANYKLRVTCYNCRVINYEDGLSLNILKS
jgi:hypothetical protein